MIMEMTIFFLYCKAYLLFIKMFLEFLSQSVLRVEMIGAP
jgi:hypothetical protein